MGIVTKASRTSWCKLGGRESVNSTIKVSGSVPANFTSSSLHYWAGALEAYASRLIDIATGVAAIQGNTEVSEEDMERAVKIFNKGVDKNLWNRLQLTISNK